MKKLVILGLAGLLGLPLATEAQRRNTTRKTTPAKTQQNNAAAQAEQEKKRQEDLSRQQAEQQRSAAADQMKQASAEANPSARPIPPSDVLFKKTIWRALDLREKQNQPMFSTGHEISKIIVDAVKRGELQAYTSDSVTTPMTAAEFSANLTPPSGVIGPEQGIPGAPARKTKRIQKKDDWTGETITVEVYEDDGSEVAGSAVGGSGSVGMESMGELFPSQLYKLELKEDVIFDKKRSRLYHDIQTVTIIMPAKFMGALGFEKPVASFKYSDLSKLFRANPEEAIWFNEQNNAQHKNLADAFDLWLFSSYITKVSNASGRTISDGTRGGLLAAQQAMEELIEFEYSLWSY